MMPKPVFVSASQIRTFQSCQKAWAFDKLDKVPRPESKAMADGTAIHKEIEEWYLSGVRPERPEALAALAHLPDRIARVRVEEPVMFLFPTVPRAVVRGFIDLRYGSKVIDHKSVAEIQEGRILTPEQLQRDPQAAIYGFHTRLMERLRDWEDVDLQWNYMRRLGNRYTKPRTEPVHAKQSLTILNDVLTSLTPTVEALVAAADGNKTSADFPGNRAHCFRYGKCPYSEVCPEFPKPKTQEIEMPLDSALLARLAVASSTLSSAKVPERPTPAEAEPPPPPAGGRPDPTLPSISSAGIDDSVIVSVIPPDAAPNVSPSDPPVPELVATKRGGKGSKNKALKGAVTTFLAGQAQAVLSAPEDVDADDEPAALASEPAKETAKDLLTRAVKLLIEDGDLYKASEVLDLAKRF